MLLFPLDSKKTSGCTPVLWSYATGSVQMDGGGGGTWETMISDT